jgi:hypothetical protein
MSANLYHKQDCSDIDVRGSGVNGIARIFAAALLAAAPAAAEVSVSGPDQGLTFTLTSETNVLTGEIASPRGRREPLLLTLTTVTRETLGSKGIDGTAGIAARAATRDMPLIYSVRLPGRTAALDELGLISIDLDDCCTLHRAYHDPATGERLFETTVPVAPLTIEGPRYKRRVAAFVARMDGREDHRAWGDTAVGMITYAAPDRVLHQILVKADSVENARRLRSLDDERTALGWVDAVNGGPIVTVPENGTVPPVLRLHFITADIQVTIPLHDDDFVPDPPPDGLTLTPQPEPVIAGGWRVASAKGRALGLGRDDAGARQSLHPVLGRTPCGPPAACSIAATPPTSGRRCRRKACSWAPA